MNWKKIFSYMVTIAKIVSFISLCLSVYIKVKTLIGTTKSKENTDEEVDDDTEVATEGKQREVPNVED